MGRHIKTTTKKPDKNYVTERIAWHPAFFEAIQMELGDYSQDLQFISEFQLTTEPLRIDVIIIKKTSDIDIKKNIASIFRKVNIVEYKSPDDYVSVRDFYMVYAYACLYMAKNELDIRDITLTFVGSRHPEKLLAHFQNIRYFSVEKKEPGIYYIGGDVLPIQIINSQRLSTEENIWFRNLNNQLDAPELKQVIDEIAKHGKAARIKAYLDVIAKANTENFEEGFRMIKKSLSFREIMEEFGVNKEWEAIGEAKGLAEGEGKGEVKKAIEIASNMLKEGFSAEQTARLSGLDISKVTELADAYI